MLSEYYVYQKDKLMTIAKTYNQFRTKFQRRHYNLIAKAIHDTLDRPTVRLNYTVFEIVNGIRDGFRLDNRNFNDESFLDAVDPKRLRNWAMRPPYKYACSECGCTCQYEEYKESQEVQELGKGDGFGT